MPIRVRPSKQMRDGRAAGLYGKNQVKKFYLYFRRPYPVNYGNMPFIEVTEKELHHGMSVIHNRTGVPIRREG